jgi:hypothetical protein
VSPGVVAVELEGGRNVFAPGEVLAGRYRLAADEPAEPEAVEVSVHWFTQGKGDEDLGVHFFERRTRESGPPPAPDGTFVTRLPRSPLSYDGVLVKVIWCVHVRAVLRGGREHAGDAYFHLGEVTPGVEVLR